MKSKGPYSILVIGKDQCELATDQVDTFADAKASTTSYLNDPEYSVDIFRVIVKDRAGVIVWDRFS